MHSEIEDFLGGTFHQDIESPEDALEEFIKDTTQLGIRQTIDHCVNFLNSNLTDHEKEKIIQTNTEIYFPAIDLSPLEWLREVVYQLKLVLKELKSY